jgi:Fur family iron response transcriptional regulator
MKAPNRSELAQRLRAHGIRPSPQRMAVALAVFGCEDHPSADRVWARARRTVPEISRATVYNTLNRLVDHGLLRELLLAEGKVVFDANLTAHHHFIDDETGRIDDVPWEALQVCNLEALTEYHVREYQVVLRGRPAAGRPHDSNSSQKSSQNQEE